MTEVLHSSIRFWPTILFVCVSLLLEDPGLAQEDQLSERETLTSGVVVDKRDLKRSGNRLTSYSSKCNRRE